MTHIITIETQSDNDFELIKGLAQRLGLRVNEQHTEIQEATSEQEAAFKKLFGSWEGEETGDELAAMIRRDRNDSPRDIEL
jgi:hypothetical protein